MALGHGPLSSDAIGAVTSAGDSSLSPSLFSDADTFYSPTVTVGPVSLAPQPFTDADTFYSPTVAFPSQSLLPATLTDGDAFYVPIVSGYSGVSVRFPASLPVPDDSYGDEHADVRSKFQPEIGHPRNRNRYRRAPRYFDVAWTLNQVEYALMHQFYYQSIRQGEREFDIELVDGDEPLSWFTVRWMGGFQSTCQNGGDSGPIWEVTARLRAIQSSFSFRPIGSDELKGLADVQFSGAGELQIAIALNGSASIDFENSGKLLMAGLTGTAFVDFTNRGRLISISTLTGETVVEFTNVGKLNDIIAPSLLNDGETFYFPTVIQDLAPGLLSDGETFYSATIVQDVAPELLDDGETFHSPTISQDVAPGLLDDGETFHAPTVS